MVAAQIEMEMDVGYVFRGVICGNVVRTEHEDCWLQDTPKCIPNGYLRKGASTADYSHTLSA